MCKHEHKRSNPQTPCKELSLAALMLVTLVLRRLETEDFWGSLAASLALDSLRDPSSRETAKG